MLLFYVLSVLPGIGFSFYAPIDRSGEYIFFLSASLSLSLPLSLNANHFYSGHNLNGLYRAFIFYRSMSSPCAMTFLWYQGQGHQSRIKVTFLKKKKRLLQGPLCFTNRACFNFSLCVQHVLIKPLLNDKILVGSIGV